MATPLDRVTGEGSQLNKMQGNRAGYAPSFKWTNPWRHTGKHDTIAEHQLSSFRNDIRYENQQTKDIRKLGVSNFLAIQKIPLAIQNLQRG